MAFRHSGSVPRRLFCRFRLLVRESLLALSQCNHLPELCAWSRPSWERLQAAKKLIDECLEEWTQNSDANLKTVVQAAFDVNKQGHINTGRVLGLRRLNIHHEKWSEAMNILSDSIQVLASKEYVRFYQRNTDGKYELINLDLATV